jgi:hypothetical protein
MAQIRHQMVIEAPAARVFPLVSTGGGFKQWWAADVTERDGATELVFFKRNTLYRLQPTRATAPREAEWRCTTGEEWAGTRIVFGLKDYFVSCNTTWGELMYRLKAAAEGKTPGPLFTMAGMAY